MTREPRKVRKLGEQAIPIPIHFDRGAKKVKLATMRPPILEPAANGIVRHYRSLDYARQGQSVLPKIIAGPSSSRPIVQQNQHS
jgi:hypothetical protein